VNYLLDACTFIWFLIDHPSLNPRIRDEIIRPTNTVYLSVISVWEIEIKKQQGRVVIPGDTFAYIHRMRPRHGVKSLPLTEECIMHLSKLPLIHRDPFDRILICQAMEHGLTILTPDPAITQYPIKTAWE
jgi:PIN domain nuclease of toxin-antitoxin system